MTSYPAAFEGKMLKYASSCAEHPKFQALRAPKSSCEECANIWKEKNEIRSWNADNCFIGRSPEDSV